MGLDRRTFLQQAGLALFTWGATEVGVSALGNNRFAASVKNYQQTLAQPTNRKLALLVGINRYPHHEDLSGCLTDVELQRELLIHRFGFNPADILTLSDRQATRENIETAFIEHLSDQARPDDVVVFHFSGYGSQIKVPLPSDDELAKEIVASTDTFRLVNSFVPVDGLSSAKQNLFANNILQETLLVLAQSLSTTKCTFVLDTSFNITRRSQHGSFKVRSIAKTAESPSSQERAFLEQLKQNLAAKGLKPSKRLLSLPGVVLSATSNNQIAVERQWNELSAGLFTQALTQHLWHITPSSKMQVALSRTAESVEQVMGRQQQPTLNNPDKSAIAYFMAASDVSAAAGVVSQVNKNGSLELKLLGLPADILSHYEQNSCFSLVSRSTDSSSKLQLKSQSGLIAKAQVISSTEQLQSGQLIRESIRMLKRDLNLNLALDSNLERIERVDATSALANIPTINSTVVAKEQNADCLLGKVAAELSATKSGKLEPETNSLSYGLYSAGGELIGKTTGVQEEAVKVAVDRLQPQFNNLLAAKWLKLTSNEFSSRLKARVTLLTGDSKQPTAWQRTTIVAEAVQPTAKKSVFSKVTSTLNLSDGVPLLPKGTEIRLQLNNLEERPLYVLFLGTDSDCNIYALYTPAQSFESEGEIQLESMQLAAAGELTIPSTENSWKWKVPESVGINTLYVVLSIQPFQKTLKAFTMQQSFKLDQQQVLNVTNPVAVINSLMQDLHDASEVEKQLLPHEDVYALDVNCWATLKFVYEVTSV